MLFFEKLKIMPSYVHKIYKFHIFYVESNGNTTQNKLEREKVTFDTMCNLARR